MSDIEKRITDVRQDYRISRVIFGFIFLAASITVSTIALKLNIKLAIAISSGFLSSYLFLTAQKIDKDITLKIKDYVQLKAEMRPPSIKITNNGEENTRQNKNR